MRRLSALGLLLGLTLGLALSRPSVKEVTFRSDPADAQVYLAEKSSSGGPYLLGNCNQKIPIELDEFLGRDTRLLFRRPGWKDAEETVKRYHFANRDHYPDLQQSPVRLEPLTDLDSRRIQAWLWLTGHILWLILLLPLLGGLHRYRLRLKRRADRGAALQALQVSGTRGPLSLARIGSYRLVDLLGAGAMGSVYRAVPDESLDEARPVAVKVLKPEFTDDRDYRRRFDREVKVCRLLRHPNIVRLLDSGEQDGVLYLVLELLQGNPLRQSLQPAGLPLEKAADYFRAVAAGLDYAHAQGVIHRDLKPDNLFVTTCGQLKILDFGLARAEGMSVATATGMVLGTPAYIAPEQLQGNPGPGSDLYALGVILFEMLAGRAPFEEPDLLVLAVKHLNSPPPLLREFRPDLPEAVEQIVARLLLKDPAQRYASAGEAARALDTAMGREADPPPATARPESGPAGIETD